MRPVSSTKNAFLKVTHVIFDLDGLILDTESIYKNVIASIAKQHGKQYTNAIRVKLLGSPDTDAARICVSEMQLPITKSQFLTEFRQRSKVFLASCPFMPGAENLIKHLSQNKVPIAVATSSSKDSANLKTAKYKDTFNLFSHIVTGGSDPEVKHGKPSPDIFLVCASRFADSPDPQKCLVFEDAPNGVLAATEAGMQCVMVPDEHITTEQTRQATQVLKSLTDVKLELFGLPPLK
ncbi:pseudouridine-5'-phosphatase-like isoform X1 [Photinus pyralis]|uniref:pseudouridine 5'-phosphatase n=1 Tax=Photinus pyralis TaxID=7054 RepID=A0A1Y1LCI7_PHOPY|nr:pseudouridine-5'-phosphatase-like isoform X1 [Photinus pyralis]XP_031344923.1 pseudouridine-5'-phosphatase-like isoform X1 [Photinus pyralis]